MVPRHTSKKFGKSVAFALQSKAKPLASPYSLYNELSNLSLYHNCDLTTIRLLYDDTTMHLTTTEVIKITICVRFDCDTTTTKNGHVHFFARVEWKQACARYVVSDHSRIATVIMALVNQTEQLGGKEENIFALNAIYVV